MERLLLWPLCSFLCRPFCFRLADYTPTPLFPCRGGCSAATVGFIFSSQQRCCQIRLFEPVQSTHPTKSTLYRFVLRGPRGLIMGGTGGGGGALTGFPANAAEDGGNSLVFHGAVLGGDHCKTFLFNQIVLRLLKTSSIGWTFSSYCENWQMKINVRLVAGLRRSNGTWVVDFSWSCAASAELASCVTRVKHLYLERAFPAGRRQSASLQTSVISMATAGPAPAI